MSAASTVGTVHDALVQVFSELDRWLELPGPHLEARPEYPGAWTVLEHLEHIGLVNHFLLLTIGKGCRKALRRAEVQAIPETESELAPLAPIADPDAIEWQPPAHMLPTGTTDPARLRALLEGQGRHCLELLAAMPGGEGRLCSIRMSVLGLGRLDMYQWLYFLAQHGRYHLTFLARRCGVEATRGGL